jgi:hypothetical protein
MLFHFLAFSSSESSERSESVATAMYVATSLAFFVLCGESAPKKEDKCTKKKDSPNI